MKRRDRYVISWATAEAFQFGHFLDGLFHALRQLRIEDAFTFALVFEDREIRCWRVMNIRPNLSGKLEISKITKPKSQKVRMRESVFSGLKEKRKPSKVIFKQNYFKHEKPIAEQGAKGEQWAKQLARRSLLLQGIDREQTLSTASPSCSIDYLDLFINLLF
jgi:hypothetical protein